LHTRSRY